MNMELLKGYFSSASRCVRFKVRIVHIQASKQVCLRVLFVALQKAAGRDFKGALVRLYVHPLVTRCHELTQ